MTHREMYERAVSALNPTEEDGLSYGMVAAALESAGGKVYVGVNVDLFCGLGYCAERNAAGTMLTEGIRLSDPVSGKNWSLGDTMMITIVRADVNLGKIDFEVAPANAK